MAYTFTSTWETKADESLNLRPALSTERIPEYPDIHRESLSQIQKQTNKQTNEISQTNKRVVEKSQNA